MSETLHQVTQQIEAAFAETEYPGDERIAVFARVGRTLADVLRGKHWSEVTLEDLYKHRWEIFLLTPDTFHYYIPIFMLAALYHYEEMDSLAHNVIFSLSPQREEHISNYFNGPVQRLFLAAGGGVQPAGKAGNSGVPGRFQSTASGREADLRHPTDRRDHPLLGAGGGRSDTHLSTRSSVVKSLIYGKTYVQVSIMEP